MSICFVHKAIGPVKVNQIKAFLGFVQYQFGIEPGFENLLLLLSIKNQLLRNKFKLQVSLLGLVVYSIKSAIAEKPN